LLIEHSACRVLFRKKENATGYHVNIAGVSERRGVDNLKSRRAEERVYYTRDARLLN
jgi:hypothetical protein